MSKLFAEKHNFYHSYIDLNRNGVDLIKLFPNSSHKFIREWSVRITREEAERIDGFTDDKLLFNYNTEKSFYLIYLINDTGNKTLIGFLLICSYPMDPYHPELYDNPIEQIINKFVIPSDNSHIPHITNPYYIHYRYLYPEYRNKGYGTRILKFLIKKGYEFMIYPTNEASIRSAIKAGCVTYGKSIIDGIVGPHYVYRTS